MNENMNFRSSDKLNPKKPRIKSTKVNRTSYKCTECMGGYKKDACILIMPGAHDLPFACVIGGSSPDAKWVKIKER